MHFVSDDEIWALVLLPIAILVAFGIKHWRDAKYAFALYLISVVVFYAIDWSLLRLVGFSGSSSARGY